MNPEEESTDSVYACPARQLWNGKRDHRNGAQGKQNSPFQKEKKSILNRQETTGNARSHLIRLPVRLRHGRGAQWLTDRAHAHAHEQ